MRVYHRIIKEFKLRLLACFIQLILISALTLENIHPHCAHQDTPKRVHAKLNFQPQIKSVCTVCVLIKHLSHHFNLTTAVNFYRIKMRSLVIDWINTDKSLLVFSKTSSNKGPPSA